MTIICSGKTVSIAYTIRDLEGKIIDESAGRPWTFTHGEGQIVPGVEQSLLGHTVGDTLDLTITPQQGYGERDLSLTSYADLEQFKDIEQLIPGTILHAEVDGETVLARVKELKEDKVLLDLNHPFAGQTLKFSVEVLSVD